MAQVVNKEVVLNEDVTMHYKVIGPHHLKDADRKDIDCQTNHTLTRVAMRDRLRRKLNKKYDSIEDGDANYDREGDSK